MILNNNNHQGVLLELLVAAKKYNQETFRKEVYHT